MVHVQDRLNIPLALKPGKATETVTVTSAAPIMQTQTAETAVDVDSKFLNDAPLANRNWIFIAQEAPGSTPFVGRGSGNGDFSSNGQHEEQNNYMLDGADNNTMNSDYINGSTYSIAPPPDAIAEFKMETSNYSAEIGRGHGAVINATTKSGTNADSRRSLGVREKYEIGRAGLDPATRLDAGGIPHESIRRYPGRTDHQEQAVFLRRRPGRALRGRSESEHLYCAHAAHAARRLQRTSQSGLHSGLLSDSAVRAQHQHRHVFVQEQRSIGGADWHASAVRHLQIYV